MQLTEVKNDIAKIIYKTSKIQLLPSDFLLIEDTNQKLIAQIIEIQTADNSDNNIALLRLSLSIDKDDKLSLYNGYIPSKKSKIIYIDPDEIIELIKGDGNGFYFGNLANHPQCYVKTSMDFLNNKLYIRSDKEDNTAAVIKNIVFELGNKSKKTVLIDTEGKYTNIKNACVIRITEDLKLPLNAGAFNNILNRDIDDCPVEDRALIQSIILEVRDYLQSLNSNFLPFSVFKNVVDDVFISNPSSGLMMFRNKLWMYAQNNLFSEDKHCFDVINEKLNSSKTVVIDFSLISQKWYDYTLQTVLNLIKEKCYLVLSLDDFSADKKFITGLYNKPNIIPVAATSYNNAASHILKSICHNYLLCKPSYSYIENELCTESLSRINSEEIILFGEGTLYLPVVAELKLIDDTEKEIITDNEIKKDVDKFISSSKSVISPELDTSNIESEEVIEPEDIFGTEDIIEAEDEPETENELEKETQPDEEIIPEEEIEAEQKNEEDIDELLDSDLDFLDEMASDSDANTDVTPEENSYDVFNPDIETNDIQADESADNEVEDTEDEVPDNTENEENVDIEQTQTEEDDKANEVEKIFEDIPEAEETIEAEENTESENILDSMENTEENAQVITDTEENSETEDTLKSEDAIETEDGIETENAAEIEISDTETVSSDEAATEENTENTEQNDVYETEETDDEIISEASGENLDSIIDEIYTEEKETADETAEMSSIDDVVNSITKNLDENYKEEDTDEISIETEDTDEDEVSDTDLSFLEDTTENEAGDSVSHKENPPEINENINVRQTKPLPVYETDTSYPLGIDDLPFKTGDTVYHPKHGRGVIEGFTNYSNKILFCQINFEDVGRRILDPRIAGIEKV